MSLRSLLLAGMATSATAVKMLVGGYGPPDSALNGSIVTLDYTGNTLKQIANQSDAGAQPAWIDKSKKPKIFSLNESWNTPNTSGIYTFTQNADGSLTKSAYKEIPRGGPVATQFYNDNKNVAVAHYGGHGITTFTVKNDAVELLQNIGYEGRPVGPKPQQADGSHVHHAVLDPTGSYIVFPDLGLDVVHVACINKPGGKLTEHADLKTPAGSGPRHAAFFKQGSTTYLAVVFELSNQVMSYKVDYVRSGGLTFTLVDTESTYGPKADPAQTQFGAAAEILVSPDNKFLLVSNRNVTLTQVPSADPASPTPVDSDSIATYKIAAGGKLDFVDLYPSGGKFPRHMALNAAGDKLAVANQNSVPGNMRIYKRDVKTGKIGEQSAAIALPGMSPNMVVWL